MWLLSLTKKCACDSILTVNRQEVRCLPTMTMTDGRRRVIPNRMGSDEVGEVDGDEEDQSELNIIVYDQCAGDMGFIKFEPCIMCKVSMLIFEACPPCFAAVCGSDGNSYPSTCHMIIESSDDTVPRVMHPGMCRPANPDRMVGLIKES